MDLAKTGRTLSRFLSHNSPAIFAGIGVAGVLTTAVLTGRATYKMGKSMADRNWENSSHHEPEVTLRQTWSDYWQLYIPAAATMFGTITAIVCSNRLGARQTAALAAAYAISETAWSEYRDKIVEKLGEKKEQTALDEIAQEKVDRLPSDNQIIILGDGNVKCMDMWSGRYFMSTMETVKAAQNAINYQINNHEFASLSDWWQWIGLEPTTESDNIGWNMDCKLELKFSTALDKHNVPVLCVHFQTHPYPF